MVTWVRKKAIRQAMDRDIFSPHSGCRDNANTLTIDSNQTGSSIVVKKQIGALLIDRLIRTLVKVSAIASVYTETRLSRKPHFEFPISRFRYTESSDGIS